MFYHVWFSPKQRKWLLQGDVELAVKASLQEVARINGIKVVACGLMIDHVHLLLDLAEDQQLSKAMNLLKGTTARRVFLQFPDLKMEAQVNHLWQKRYGHKVISPNAVARVVGYIESQWERPEKFDR